MARTGLSELFVVKDAMVTESGNCVDTDDEDRLG